MIHTFELSMMLSKTHFEEIIKTAGIRYYRRCWVTDQYKDAGIPKIRLYKWLRKELEGKNISGDSDFSHRYMVSVTVNPSAMFGGDSNLATDITAFGEAFVEAIYRKIFEVLPCIEQIPECYTENAQARLRWKEANIYGDGAFLARRIDYTFDLARNRKLYLKLIDQGYSLRSRTYERCYYPTKNNQPEKTYDIDSMPDDDDDVLPQNVYFKSSAKHPNLKINIYHKQTELGNRNLPGASDTDFDFLRIEVQALKGKLSNIVDKIGAPKRQLLHLATPEAEKYVLEYYVTMLTGKGQVYVSGKNAKKAILAKGYKTDKANRLMAVIDAVAVHHGISKVLKGIEAGAINNLGNVAAVKRYLRIIENEVGINPVTISQNDKGILDISLNNGNGTYSLQQGAILGLVQYIQAYSQSVTDGLQSWQKEYEEVTKP